MAVPGFVDQRLFRRIRMRKYMRFNVAAAKITRFFRKVMAKKQLKVTVILARLARVVEVEENLVSFPAV